MNRQFEKLVLNFIKKHGDNNEHDAAGRMLSELDARDVKSAPVAESTGEAVPTEAEPATAAAEPAELPEMTQEPAPEPVVEEPQPEN